MHSFYQLFSKAFQNAYEDADDVANDDDAGDIEMNFLSSAFIQIIQEKDEE